MTARFSPTTLKLLGSGVALPGPAIGNDELLLALSAKCGHKKAKLAGKYAERLGIRSRHVSRDLTSALSGARSDCDAPTLCTAALIRAARDASMSYIIGHTSTPHTLLPPNVSWVAEKLNYAGPYLELRQACTGFANALAISAAMIAEDRSARVAIVGSENGSPFFDMRSEFATREQLINFVQMGDGAGAVLLGPNDDSDSETISDIFVGHIGIGMEPGIAIEGGGSAAPYCEAGVPYFRHRARDVRKSGEKLILAGIEAVKSRGQDRKSVV